MRDQERAVQREEGWRESLGEKGEKILVQAWKRLNGVTSGLLLLKSGGERARVWPGRRPGRSDRPAAVDAQVLTIDHAVLNEVAHAVNNLGRLGRPAREDGTDLKQILEVADPVSHHNAAGPEWSAGQLGDKFDC